MENISMVDVNNAKNIMYNHKGKIKVTCNIKSYEITLFLIITTILAITGILFLDIDWIKIISRVPDVGNVFLKLMELDFSKISIISEAFLETIAIVILATVYSLINGIIFGMFAANNMYNIRFLSVGIKMFFTLLRAIPTPVWVLLMLVCLGMGPQAGIAGLLVHSTAFFTKVFAQSFEDISKDTINSLEAAGASKLQIFTSAILPSSIYQITAWIGIRFEVNFAESSYLGMIGAGGIGFVISTAIQNYEYGTAGVALLLVVVFAYIVERIFIRIKSKIK